MRVALLVVLLCAACAAAGDVIDLTDADFQDSVDEGLWLVDFFAPWCAHCKTLAPIYEGLATDLKGQVNVAKVDCTVNHATCHAFGIRGYPTIKLLSGGRMILFRGERSHAVLKNFCLTSDLSNASPAPELPRSPKEEVKEFEVKSGDEGKSEEEKPAHYVKGEHNPKADRVQQPHYIQGHHNREYTHLGKEPSVAIYNWIRENTVVVFSKTTCHACLSAVSLFQQIGCTPYVVDLDVLTKGPELEASLLDSTDQAVLPNVFINGEHAGGLSDIAAMASAGELDELQEQCAMTG